jgi:hypothetical protein
MASDFDAFLQRLLEPAQVPTPPPVQPVAPVVAPPQPLPPSQPQQQRGPSRLDPIAQAAAGLPPTSWRW